MAEEEVLEVLLPDEVSLVAADSNVLPWLIHVRLHGNTYKAINGWFGLQITHYLFGATHSKRQKLCLASLAGLVKTILLPLG